MTADSVVLIMVDNFFSKISEVENLSDTNINDLFEILTLASIVEREYRVDEEAPLIASVFKNRLSRIIGLYSCATVEYIITEIQRIPHPDVILISDTKIDNPYNTYKYEGLPPTPICSPGKAAIMATAHPDKTPYLYFVASGSGGHNFAKTLNEHNANVAHYKRVIKK
jgi:UPF0755 protein